MNQPVQTNNQRINIIYKLFFIFCGGIMFLASLMPTLYLYKWDPIFISGVLIFLVVSFGIVWYGMKDKVLSSRGEIFLLLGIGIMGILLRLMAADIFRTVPISDFNTPNEVYNLIQSSGPFTYQDNPANLNYYQLYYTRFPAWAPYFWIVSTIYDAFGFNPEYIKLFNIVMFALTILFMYQGTKNLFSKKVAILAILIFALSPSLIVYTSIATPDHITILLMAIIIYFWSYFIKYRNQQAFQPALISMICVIIFSALLNYFKPLSILLLLVFICAELIMYVLPNFFKITVLKAYLKQAWKYIIIFIAGFLIVNSITTSLLNRGVERFVKAEVVSSIGLYMLWGYAIDEYGNYNPDVATQIFQETLTKYGNDQKATFKEIDELALQQFKENLPYLTDIIKDKFKIAFESEGDYFYFANTNADINYTQSLNTVLGKPFGIIAGGYMAFILLFVAIAGVGLVGQKHNSLESVILYLMIIGFTFMLVLGGVQGRYKSIIMPQLCIIAAYGINLICNKLQHSLKR